MSCRIPKKILKNGRCRPSENLLYQKTAAL